ncbi:PREDICTED: uncharacterized protein LOC109217530 [Nicotiana attenuata]|uniref:uncharacterized protein LOC109217530 n=1 Tax=Nicotiana attenuata TaxID=49451 RepID=UPI000904A65E|nr:PREDICTED: uncharacterized protein LOC109217530 [Nicotiana attenuata]
METPKQASWVIRKIFEARKWLTNGVQELETYVEKGKYSIKKAYISQMQQYAKPSWKSLYLTKGLMPRHQFIMWMALHQKLATVERVIKWGINVAKECVLCTSGKDETMEHLFFECAYSKFVWDQLLQLFEINRTVGNWQEEVNWMTMKTKKRDMKWTILGNAFAATVYQIWRERNFRRFQQISRESKDLVRDIVLHLHMREENYCKWKGVLEKIDRFPC